MGFKNSGWNIFWGKVLADFFDDDGDNISERNCNYSELTASYWVWKHSKNDYVGLFHYRRILDVNDRDIVAMKDNKIDAVLPLPIINSPDINEHHKRWIKEGDWQTACDAIKSMAPQYYEAMQTIFSDKYFYNFNMLIARRDVFNDYCAWIFPILDRIYETSMPKGVDRADRYIGYIGENLTSLYFMYHQQDLKIAHAGRIMLI